MAGRRASRRGRTQRGLPGVETRLVGRDARARPGPRGARGAARRRAAASSSSAGEAGIGKTPPARRAARALAERARDVRWLEGRCVSYGESLPYWPFRDLLRGEWIGAGADERGAARARRPAPPARAALRRRGPTSSTRTSAACSSVALEPDAAARTSQLSPEALQWRTFEVVGAALRAARGGRRRSSSRSRTSTGPTRPRCCSLEQLLSLAEEAPVLLVLSLRPGARPPALGAARARGARVPAPPARARARPARATPTASCSRRSSRRRRSRPSSSGACSRPRTGNPFFLEELVRSLADVGALVRTDDGWRFDHAVEVEVPPTVEKVDPRAARPPLAAGARRSSPPRPRSGARSRCRCSRASLGRRSPGDALHELQRLGLLRQSRRWPQPEYRFRHALIQETAYRTLLAEQRTRAAPARGRVARGAVRRAATPRCSACSRTTGSRPRTRTRRPTTSCARATRRGSSTRSTRRSSTTATLLPLLERRGERQEIALVLFKLALALHTSLRFAEANETYQRAFEHWTPPEPRARRPSALRVATSFLPNDLDPKTRDRVAEHPALHAALRPARRGVAGADDRPVARRALGDLGRRAALRLPPARGADLVRRRRRSPPTTSSSGSSACSTRRAPARRSRSTSCSRTARTTYLGRNTDADAVGVRALDDRTVEFRLVAPAPYFMSVMNRPDGGPAAAPRDRARRRRWSAPSAGRERRRSRSPSAPTTGSCCERRVPRAPRRQRRRGRALPHGDRRRAAGVRARRADLVLVRYTPRLADLMPGAVHADAVLGSPRVVGVHPLRPHASGDWRTSSCGARSRTRSTGTRWRRSAPANLVVATGGVVPPALQGHTPDIALRYDPDLAREYLARSGFDGPSRARAG